LALAAVLSCSEDHPPNSPPVTTADRLQAGWWLLDCPDCGFFYSLRFLPDNTLQEIQWTATDTACASSTYNLDLSLLTLCPIGTDCMGLVITWCSDEYMVVTEFGTTGVVFGFIRAPDDPTFDAVFSTCGGN
jgi:hypothetical protein